MKFEKMDNGTLRCFLTIEDLEENGIELEDFFSNSSLAREFLEKIMQIAEDEVGFRASGNMLTIQAALVSEEELVLTFSEGQMNGLELLEHLKHMLGAAASELDALPDMGEEAEDVFLGLNHLTEEKKTETKEEYSYLLTFVSVAGAQKFCSVLSEAANIPSRLYYSDKKQQYFLWADLNKKNKSYIYEFVTTSMEYAKGIEKDSAYRNYLEEHGKIIIKEKALEVLSVL